MALSELDRNLLARCLAHKPRAWEDFVDRFMGLVIHVIDHSANSRSVQLAADDREDLIGEVFLRIVKDDMAVLRHFRGESSLATYLTVVTRRVVIHKMLKRHRARRSEVPVEAIADDADGSIDRLSERDEVARLLDELEGVEAEVVRLYHLEGKSYGEISSMVGMPENSIGPTLSRAREKMRRANVE